MAPRSLDEKLEHGIPIFLTQLVEVLKPVAPANTLHLVGAADGRPSIGASAGLNGSELLQNGFTIAQVVHGYGDVCQVVTNLASELNASISPQDFHVFNRCLDDAIAGGVTAYGKQREHDLAFASTERLGVLAHELRNLLHTAVLSFDAIKRGTVGVHGSTAAVHARSLSRLRILVERSLAEVRLGAGVPALEHVSVVEFLEEVEVSATMEAESHGLTLRVDPVDDVTIDADRQLLSSALLNLLQNAFKFTKPHGTVTLTTRVTADRVLLDVCDECGGLPPGKAEELFRPFNRRASDRPAAKAGAGVGLGLGLGIALAAVRANSGDIHVRDIPGKGCVFTIDLPRQPSPPKGVSLAAADGERGVAEGSAEAAGAGAQSGGPKPRAR